MLNVGAALQHNPTGQTYRNVPPFIAKTDASSLADFSGSRNLESYFKMAANESQFARDFRAMINANRNIKFLLSFTTSGGRIFPAFDTMGTVTARIQTSSPNVQQLRRAFRTRFPLTLACIAPIWISRNTSLEFSRCLSARVGIENDTTPVTYTRH
jgi:hypothetical protein